MPFNIKFSLKLLFVFTWVSNCFCFPDEVSQGFNMCSMLASSYSSSCLHLPSEGIIGLHHHTWLLLSVFSLYSSDLENT